MSAYAISSFIDGFFKGRDWRDSKEAAKYERDRQKRLDEITFNQERRAQEEFDYTQGERARARDKQDRIQVALDEALAATQAGVPASGGAQPALTVSTQGGNAVLPTVMPPTLAPAGLGATPPVAAPMTLPAVAPPAPQAVPFQAQTPAVAATIPSPAPNSAVGPRAVPASGQIVPAMPMPSNPVLQTQGPGPTGRIDPALYEMGALPRRFQQDPMAAPMPPQAAPVTQGQPDLDAMARAAAQQALPLPPNPDHQFLQSGGFVGDVREIGRRANANIPAIAGATMNAARAVNDTFNPAERLKDTLIPLANPVLDYTLGVRLPTDAQAPAAAQPAAPSATPPATPTPPAPGPQQLGPLKSNLPANATPQQAQAVTQAAAAVNPAAPSASVLAATAPTGMGAAPAASTKGKPLPADMEARKERATTAFMERYMQVGAPIVMEEMLRQGNIEGAMKFQEWIDTASTQRAMKAYAGFMFAASMGDHEGALDAYTEMFNNNDYLANGLEIQRDQSQFTKDKDGNITGAVITFKDEKGNLYEQVFDDIGDMYELGALFGAPENGFKLAGEKAAAQAEMAKGAIKKTEDQQAARAEFIRKQAPEFMKGDPLSGVAPMSQEEAIAAASAMFDQSVAASTPGQDSLGALPADLAGQPPVVAFRP